CMRVLQTPHSF
nr:immunoglobulin light chain junction region [Macaca mulatta]MPN88596.1 immunoglobulin light chain junction region [Macaca mulatta]